MKLPTNASFTMSPKTMAEYLALSNADYAYPSAPYTDAHQKGPEPMDSDALNVNHSKSFPQAEAAFAELDKRINHATVEISTTVEIDAVDVHAAILKVVAEKYGKEFLEDAALALYPKLAHTGYYIEEPKSYRLHVMEEKGISCG